MKPKIYNKHDPETPCIFMGFMGNGDKNLIKRINKKLLKLSGNDFPKITSLDGAVESFEIFNLIYDKLWYGYALRRGLKLHYAFIPDFFTPFRSDHTLVIISDECTPWQLETRFGRNGKYEHINKPTEQYIKEIEKYIQPIKDIFKNCIKIPGLEEEIKYNVATWYPNP